MKDLTKVEETVMVAVWRLGEEAYGVTIKNQIKEAIGREYLYSTLYTVLEQLVNKGYLTKRYGEPTAERGGKRKIFFSISETGFESLKQAFEKIGRQTGNKTDSGRASFLEYELRENFGIGVSARSLVRYLRAKSTPKSDVLNKLAEFLDR